MPGPSYKPTSQVDQLRPPDQAGLGIYKVQPDLLQVADFFVDTRKFRINMSYHKDNKILY
jgi:hypothetical protein